MRDLTSPLLLNDSAFESHQHNEHLGLSSFGLPFPGVMDSFNEVSIVRIAKKKDFKLCVRSDITRQLLRQISTNASDLIILMLWSTYYETASRPVEIAYSEHTVS